MVDIATTLKDLISSEWIETDPALADLKFCIQDYGKDSGDTLFDPNEPTPQIAIAELEKKSIQLAGVDYRTEHTATILVYLKPADYQPATITAARTTFANMIEEVDRILKAEKYTTDDINDIQLSTWRYQTKKKNEPIIFLAAQDVKAVYYE